MTIRIKLKAHPHEYKLRDTERPQYKYVKVSESGYTLLRTKHDSPYIEPNTHVFEKLEGWKNVKLPIRSAYRSTKNRKNVIAFNKFKAEHMDDPEFKDRFVAFVHGEFQAVGDKEVALIEQMYDRFGNVPMCVDVMNDRQKIVYLRTPRFERIDV